MIFMIYCHLSLSNYIPFFFSHLQHFFPLSFLGYWLELAQVLPSYYARFEYFGKPVEKESAPSSIQVYQKIMSIEMEDSKIWIGYGKQSGCRITNLMSWTLPVMHSIFQDQLMAQKNEWSWSNPKNVERSSPRFWYISVGKYAETFCQRLCYTWKNKQEGAYYLKKKKSQASLLRFFFFEL